MLHTIRLDYANSYMRTQQRSHLQFISNFQYLIFEDFAEFLLFSFESNWQNLLTLNLDSSPHSFLQA